MLTKVVFERSTAFAVAHDVPEHEVKHAGPFEWVQLTYNVLRTSPDGEHLAVLDAGGWTAEDGSKWSDVVIE